MTEPQQSFQPKTLADRLREAETKPRVSIKSIRSEALSMYKERLEFSPSEKWRILKNVAMTSLSFTFLYTAFQGMMNIQSSINPENGLGTYALSMIYLAQMVSCLFLPKLMIDKLTIKWTMVVTLSFYAFYISAQFYPRFSTLLPTALLVGLGAAPMWAAHSTYLTQLAQVYSKIVGQDTDAVIVRFFGFFFFAFQTQDLWGNLISSLVFLSNDEVTLSTSVTTTTPYENPLLPSVRVEEIIYCGAAFCRFSDEQEEAPQPRSQVNLITLIYLICVIMSVIIAFLFLDPLTRYGEKLEREDEDDMTISQLVMATLNQLKRPKQQLLIFITIFSGMEQAWSATEYTQAFITCALGVGQIGFIMISFGVFNCSAAMIFGYLVEYIGRAPIFTFGVIGHSCILVWAMFWIPNPDQIYLFYVYASLWGMFDGLWQAQVNGLYGSMFKANKEAAFSNYRLFEAMGFALSLGTSTLFCLRTKCIILLIVLLLGGLGYGIVEFKHTRKERQIAKMEAAPSFEEQKQAQMLRVQSQSFDPLEEVVDVIDDDEDNASGRSEVSHTSRFRKSVAFFVGTDVLREKTQDSRRVTRRENISTHL